MPWRELHESLLSERQLSKGKLFRSNCLGGQNIQGIILQVGISWGVIIRGAVVQRGNYSVVIVGGSKIQGIIVLGGISWGVGGGVIVRGVVVQRGLSLNHNRI